MENCIGREDFYEELTLNETMKKFESERSTELKREGKMQMNYTKSTDGWIATLFIIQGRAIDWMIFPWIFATLHATIYTVVQEMWVIRIEQDMTSWEVFFSFVLNSTLSFLLVFRLNRAAGRFWAARKYWGDIVAQVRSCVGGLIIHGSHNIAERDNTIRWIVAFTISTMELLRGEKRYPQNILAGILKQSEVEDLERQPHPPMYAVDRARYHMNQIFKVDADTAPHLAFSMTQQMNTLENQLNVMIWSGG